MPITRFWLTRHAESAEPSVFHGAESDIVLSDRGHRQASAAAEWFRYQRPTRVVSSRMRRAMQTADPIARTCSIPHTIEDRLHERIIGELCGVPFSKVDGPWAATVQEWIAGNTSYTTPGAESFVDMQNRLLPVWDELASRFAGERVVVVSHGVVCKVLLVCLLHQGQTRHWESLGRVENLATSELVRDTDGRWTAERLLVVPEPVRLVNTDHTRQLTRSEA